MNTEKIILLLEKGGSKMKRKAVKTLEERKNGYIYTSHYPGWVKRNRVPAEFGDDNLKAFGDCACIKKFIVVDANTKKAIFRKRFETNQGSCQHPNITMLPEFRKLIRGYLDNLIK